MMGMPTNPMRYEGVYYAESMTRGHNLNPVAICPKINGKKIEWGDTSHGTARKIAEIRLFDKQGTTVSDNRANPKVSSPEKIVLKTEDNELVQLTKMTLDVYNRFVRHRVAGNPEFHSDDEVQSYFMNTNFEAPPSSGSMQ